MDFDVKRVGSALLPEALGVLGFVVAKMGARYIDETYELTGAFRRTSDYVEAAAVLIPGYLIATDSPATNSAKAVLYTEIGFLGQRGGDAAYKKVVTARRLGNKGKGGNVLNEAEKVAALAEAQLVKERSLVLRDKPATSLAGYTEI